MPSDGGYRRHVASKNENDSDEVIVKAARRVLSGISRTYSGRVLRYCETIIDC